MVDLARVGDRLANGLLGDLVELDAPHRDGRVEDLAQVPADRLALAVGVGRQQDLGRLADGSAEVADAADTVARNDVVGPEAVLDVHAHAAPRLVLDLCRDLARILGEVANVADAGLDPVLVAEQACERPGLRRRLDDHQWLRHRCQPFAVDGPARFVRLIGSGV